MNLSDMRTLVRRDLKDEDSYNYRWQDNEIDRAIQRAVAELSRYVPREMKTTIATTNGSRDISISTLTNRICIDRVEFPVSQFPRRFQRFAAYQDTLTLIGDTEVDGANCYIYWGQVHTLDGSTSSIPAYLEDLLAMGAAAYAVLSQAQYKSDTANTGGEDVDRDYNTWAKERLSDFREQLKKYAKNRKLKISQFYQGDDAE
jgi:hypothetical protein